MARGDGMGQGGVGAVAGAWRLAAALLPMAIAGIAAVSATAAEPPAARGPNILFILADDLGWRDTGCYGSTFYRTPHIDALARRGMRFTQAYSASPLCSPTRSSILTGLFPARIGLTTPSCHVAEEILQSTVGPKAPRHHAWLPVQSVTRLKLEYHTLAESLRAAGYATAHFGKWHLGPEPYDPLHQGFQVDLPHTPAPGPYTGYLAPWKFWPDQGRPGEHIEDRMADEAIAWMRKHRQQPFLLNYWAFSVHAPYNAKEEVIARHRPRVDEANPQNHPVMAAMIEHLDDNVGRLVRALDDLGLASNTVIVFNSDNGGNMYDRPEEKTPTNNHPLRSGKASIYEGGTRVPLIVAWPGVTSPGTVNDSVVQSTDFFPTFVELLRLPPPPGVTFDGRSFAPALRGRPHDRGPLFCHFPHAVGGVDRCPASYVRVGDWKLIRFYQARDDRSDRLELYNLRDDLGETRDLASARPEKAQELNRLLDRFLADTRAVLPQPNPDYDPESAVVVDGWRATFDAGLRPAETHVVLRSRGNDPQMATTLQPPLTGPLRLAIRMKSDSRGPAMVYWAVGQKQPHHRQRSVTFQPQHDGQWHEYTVELPVQGPIAALRFDPCTAPGEIALEWIRATAPDGSLLKTWSFQQAK